MINRNKFKKQKLREGKKKRKERGKRGGLIETYMIKKDEKV